MSERFRFYREHKYVIGFLIEFHYLVAKAYFSEIQQVKSIKDEFSKVVALIECHAEHEDKAILDFLKKKNSSVYKQCNDDHDKQHELFQRMLENLDMIIACNEPEKRVHMGYQFYMDYQQFFGDSLKHMHAEETIIMPELQRLYTDEELKAIEFNTYDIMTPNEMVHMIKALFPHFNTADKETFISVINEAQPQKLSEAWHGFIPYLSKIEEKYFMEKFNVQPKEIVNEKTELYYAWEKEPEGVKEIVLTQHQRPHYENVIRESNKSKEEFLREYYNK